MPENIWKEKKNKVEMELKSCFPGTKEKGHFFPTTDGFIWCWRETAGAVNNTNVLVVLARLVSKPVGALPLVPAHPSIPDPNTGCRNLLSNFSRRSIKRPHEAWRRVHKAENRREYLSKDRWKDPAKTDKSPQSVTEPDAAAPLLTVERHYRALDYICQSHNQWCHWKPAKHMFALA